MFISRERHPSRIPVIELREHKDPARKRPVADLAIPTITGASLTWRRAAYRFARGQDRIRRPPPPAPPAHSIVAIRCAVQYGDADNDDLRRHEGSHHPHRRRGGFAAMRASRSATTIQHACRPWDNDRDGFHRGRRLPLSVLVLGKNSNTPSAVGRDSGGWRAMGYRAMHHITSPSDDGDGAYRVMRSA